MCQKPSPPPPHPSTKGLNFALRPHPNWPVMFWTYIRLLQNFPVSQIVGCRCTLLAGNSSISLAGSEKRIHFSQQSSKILKMALEVLFMLMLVLGLSLKISRWVSCLLCLLCYSYLLFMFWSVIFMLLSVWWRFPLFEYFVKFLDRALYSCFG